MLFRHLNSFSPQGRTCKNVFINVYLVYYTDIVGKYIGFQLKSLIVCIIVHFHKYKCGVYNLVLCITVSILVS